MSYHLLSEVQRTARKPHRCIWCGESIKAGNAYTDERSVYDGHMQHHRWHPECLGAARDGWQAGDDPEFIPHDNERPAADDAAPEADPIAAFMEQQAEASRPLRPGEPCPDCDGTGTAGGQFTGGYWPCDRCGATGAGTQEADR